MSKTTPPRTDPHRDESFDGPITPDAAEAAERETVEREQAELRDFVRTLSMADVKSGNWFEKLCEFALRNYTEKVDWRYFQQKYPGMPADLIVDQRIKLAARYASLEGGITAGAYTGAVAATIGTIGGASPLAIPAAATSAMVDIAYVTRLQLHLAYDIAVLYRVPLDIGDPSDLWKLVKVAFGIKATEAAGNGALKLVPLAVRPLVRKFVSGPTLKAVQNLPLIGTHVLQRHIIKIGIPAVGVPLSVGINFYSTKVIGAHARSIFRNEARIIEVADKLCRQTRHPELLPWVALAVILADRRTADDETVLLRYLLQALVSRYEVDDEEFAELIDLDRREVWDRVRHAPGDKSDLILAAEQVASIDAAVNAQEKRVLDELRACCV